MTKIEKYDIIIKSIMKKQPENQTIRLEVKTIEQLKKAEGIQDKLYNLYNSVQVVPEGQNSIVIYARQLIANNKPF